MAQISTYSCTKLILVFISNSSFTCPIVRMAWSSMHIYHCSIKLFSAKITTLDMTTLDMSHLFYLVALAAFLVLVQNTIEVKGKSISYEHWMKMYNSPFYMSVLEITLKTNVLLSYWCVSIPVGKGHVGKLK